MRRWDLLELGEGITEARAERAEAEAIPRRVSALVWAALCVFDDMVPGSTKALLRLRGLLREASTLVAIPSVAEVRVEAPSATHTFAADAERARKLRVARLGAEVLRKATQAAALGASEADPDAWLVLAERVCASLDGAGVEEASVEDVQLEEGNPAGLVEAWTSTKVLPYEVADASHVTPEDAQAQYPKALASAPQPKPSRLLRPWTVDEVTGDHERHRVEPSLVEGSLAAWVWLKKDPSATWFWAIAGGGTGHETTPAAAMKECDVSLMNAGWLLEHAPSAGPPVAPGVPYLGPMGKVFYKDYLAAYPSISAVESPSPAPPAKQCAHPWTGNKSSHVSVRHRVPPPGTPFVGKGEAAAVVVRCQEEDWRWTVGEDFDENATVPHGTCSSLAQAKEEADLALTKLGWELWPLTYDDEDDDIIPF